MKKCLFDNKYTIIYEAINNNHIVKYDNKQIITFAIVKRICDKSLADELHKNFYVIHPLEAYILLKLWKFNIPNYECVHTNNIKEIEILDKKYEQLINCEGAVIYDIYNKDNIVLVGKIYKHKCHDYVIKRMSRELIKRKASYNDWISRFKKAHIIINQESHDILLGFYVWLRLNSVELKAQQNSTLIAKLLQLNSVEPLAQQNSTLIAKLLQLNKNKSNDWSDYIHENFIILYDEFLLDINYKEYYKQASNIIKPENNVNTKTQVIMLVGIQGSGKSTIRNILQHINKNVKYINQDELGSKKAFLNELHKKYSDNTILVIDKCNILITHRNDIYNYFSNILIVELVDSDVINTCMKRIKERGAYHLSLPYTYNTKNIIENFYTKYDQITDYEKQNYKYLSINISDTIEYNVQQILKEINLDQLIENISNININYQKSIIKTSIKNAIYIQASADPICIINSVQHILNTLVDNKYIIKNEFHMTLYFGKYKEDNIKYFDNIYITVHAESIVYDDKCIAIKITKDEKLICDNMIPHITLGCIENTKSIYANTMLENMENTNIIKCDFNLDLIINPVYKKS